jgi:hypothetical protein
MNRINKISHFSKYFSHSFDSINQTPSISPVLYFFYNGNKDTIYAQHVDPDTFIYAYILYNFRNDLS